MRYSLIRKAKGESDKVLIIGEVAGGATTAARLRRLGESRTDDAAVVVLFINAYF